MKKISNVQVYLAIVILWGSLFCHNSATPPGFPEEKVQLQHLEAFLRELSTLQEIEECVWSIVGRLEYNIIPDLPQVILNELTNSTNLQRDGENQERRKILQDTLRLRQLSPSCVVVLVHGTSSDIADQLAFHPTIKTFVSDRTFFTTLLFLLHTGLSPAADFYKKISDDIMTKVYHPNYFKSQRKDILATLNHPHKLIISFIDDDEVSISTIFEDRIKGDKERYHFTNLPKKEEIGRQLFSPLSEKNGDGYSLRILANTNLSCWEIFQQSKEGASRGKKELLPIVEFAVRSNFTCELSESFRKRGSFPDVYPVAPMFRHYFNKYEFSPLLYRDEVGFCFRKQDRLFSPRNIYKSLSKIVWLCLLITGIASSLTFAVITHFRQRELASSRKFSDILQQWTWNLFGTVLLQGLQLKDANRDDVKIKKPKSLAVKLQLFYATWLFFVMIMTVAYSSNLVSILTSLEDSQEMPTSFRELVDFQWTSGTPHLAIFTRLKLNESLQVFAGRVEEFRDEAACVKKIMSTFRFACLGMINHLEILAKQQDWNAGMKNDQRYVKRVSKDLPVIHLGVAWQWSSPFKRQFRKIILRLLQAGYPRFWERKEKESWGLSEGQSPWQPNSRPIVLNILHLQGCFLILTAGLFSTGLCFIGECLKKGMIGGKRRCRCCNRRRKVHIVREDFKNIPVIQVTHNQDQITKSLA